MKHRVKLVLGSLVAICLTFLVPTGTSQAAVSATGVRLPMTVVGFNEQIANAHGYKIIRDADGRPIASVRKGFQVPMDAPATKEGLSRSVSPSNVVEGPCGESYFWMTPTGAAYQVDVTTGFSVVGEIYAWEWITYYSDGVSNTNKNWIGDAAGSEINLSYIYTAHGHTTIVGGASTSSYALLFDGRLCSSGGPFDSQVV